MLPPDDPHFRFEDDPRPPEPDTAVLQRVVARGRRRLFRRRAVLGGAAVAVAAVLVSSGVAVAQHHRAGPSVAVSSPGDVAVDESSTTTTTLVVPESTPATTTGNASPRDSTPTTSPQGQSCYACAAMFPAPAGTQAATPADFIGEVKLTATEVTAGDDIGVELDLHNATDHPVDVEGGLGGPATAVVCAHDLTPDGHTNTPLHNENPDANIFWIVAPVTDPGEFAGIGPMTINTTAAEVGVVTCEAVLVRSPRDGVDLSAPGYVIARLDNIPAVTYTVLPAPDGTTTTTSVATDTSTTTPVTTVPSQ